MVRYLLSSLLILSIFCGAQAKKPSCTDTEAKRAMTRADTLRSWDALYEFHKVFRGCDDGAVAEGYSESVARVLVDHWNTLPRLVELARKEGRFRQFVLAHVNATLDANDLQNIRAMATRRCPAGLRGLCVDLSKNADAALQDAASP